MNSVKAKGDKGLMVGEGMSGVMSFGMIVSISMSCYFGGKGFLPFAILAYKCGF